MNSNPLSVGGVGNVNGEPAAKTALDTAEPPCESKVAVKTV